MATNDPRPGRPTRTFGTRWTHGNGRNFADISDNWRVKSETNQGPARPGLVGMRPIIGSPSPPPSPSLSPSSTAFSPPPHTRLIRELPLADVGTDVERSPVIGKGSLAGKFRSASSAVITVSPKPTISPSCFDDDPVGPPKDDVAVTALPSAGAPLPDSSENTTQSQHTIANGSLPSGRPPASGQMPHGTIHDHVSIDEVFDLVSALLNYAQSLTLPSSPLNISQIPSLEGGNFGDAANGEQSSNGIAQVTPDIKDDIDLTSSESASSTSRQLLFTDDEGTMRAFTRESAEALFRKLNEINEMIKPHYRPVLRSPNSNQVIALNVLYNQALRIHDTESRTTVVSTALQRRQTGSWRDPLIASMYRQIFGQDSSGQRVLRPRISFADFGDQFDSLVKYRNVLVHSASGREIASSIIQMHPSEVCGGLEGTPTKEVGLTVEKRFPRWEDGKPVSPHAIAVYVFNSVVSSLTPEQYIQGVDEGSIVDKTFVDDNSRAQSDQAQAREQFERVHGPMRDLGSDGEGV